MKRAFASVIAQRIGGDKPSTPRAIFAAAIAGAAAAGLTYKALRV
jgi:hypothetical protein